MRQEAHARSLSVLAAEPATIIDAVLGIDRRVLFIGQLEIGKSTLVNALAEALGRAGRACWCISADPGSPVFGVPGAVCLGRWEGQRWALAGVEALCTLMRDAFACRWCPPWRASHSHCHWGWFWWTGRVWCAGLRVQS